MSTPREPAAPSADSEGANDAVLRPGPRYLVALVAGSLLGCLLLLAVFRGLEVAGRLPPPAFANNVCLDEKLAFMRGRSFADANLLVLGSSVAWRHFDSALAESERPGTRAFNGGFCGMTTAQSEYAADWLLSRMPSVLDVVMIVSPLDLTGCGANDAPFDRDDVDQFVFSDGWRWSYYLRYFDSLSFIRNSLHIAAQRTGAEPLDAFIFSEHGDGPMDTDVSRGLTYEQVPQFSGACFTALHRLSQRLSQEGRTMTVVTTPIHPDWTALYDPDGATSDRMRREIKSALASTGARFLDGQGDTHLPSSAFTDAIHLRWSAAKQFTRFILRNLPPPRVGPEADRSSHSLPGVR